MDKTDINNCEILDCWFYISNTPTKGQGDWCGAIHKGACKLNSTDCKDTPIEKCLIKSLHKQLKQVKAENEKLRKENEEMYKMGCENFVAIDQAKRLYKLNNCVDEIEEILTTCKNNFWTPCIDCKYENQCNDRDVNSLISQKIKEAKGNE